MSTSEFEQLLDETMQLVESGRTLDAQRLLLELRERFPAQSEPPRLLGVLALQRGDLESAQTALQRAHELAPASTAILCNLGALARATGDDATAESRYRQALGYDPRCVPAHNNVAGLLLDQHRFEEAERHYRHALDIAPGYVPARSNLSACLLSMDRGRDALAEAEYATRNAPAYPPAWLALARAQLALGLAERARASFERTATLGLYSADTCYGLAQACDDLGDWSASLSACEQALRLDTAHAAAASLAQYLRRRLCRFEHLDDGRKRLLALLDIDAEGIAPFAFLSEEATPSQQQRAAALAASETLQRIGPAAAVTTVREASHDGKPRIGFVSSGFGQHPTALLIVDLVERLRDGKIETIGYATTPDDGGELRRRLSHAFVQLHDLSALSHTAMAQRIARDKIDVLIDLRGWGGGSVADVFARRPAPIQVNWLAYPGTSGAPWIDYLIADPFVVPDSERPHYSEAVVRLPHCFQPSDTTRLLIPPPSRTSLGLPEEATIFVCFNNSYKYSPESLTRFWQVLRGVPDAVLWLLGGKQMEVHDNLRASARSADIDPARVIFLPKQPHEVYLACYAHADLFLDTTPYNAHTTASDALWAGCPVLTLPGLTFASRVAGSLNATLGLPEMNARDETEFVDTAIQLGNDRSSLATLRTRLAKERIESPLFDMPRFANDFTRAMMVMVERHRSGNAPADVDLAS